jgi:hypothetical protein
MFQPTQCTAKDFSDSCTRSFCLSSSQLQVRDLRPLRVLELSLGTCIGQSYASPSGPATIRATTSMRRKTDKGRHVSKPMLYLEARLRIYLQTAVLVLSLPLAPTLSAPAPRQRQACQKTCTCPSQVQCRPLQMFANSSTARPSASQLYPMPIYRERPL